VTANHRFNDIVVLVAGGLNYELFFCLEMFRTMLALAKTINQAN